MNRQNVIQRHPVTLTESGIIVGIAIGQHTHTPDPGRRTGNREYQCPCTPKARHVQDFVMRTFLNDRLAGGIVYGSTEWTVGNREALRKDLHIVRV